jgi:hypothetical protein
LISFFHLDRALAKVSMLVIGILFGGASAQAPFPPLAASQATTAQGALAALSVPQGEPSTYLRLDLPEVAVPGKIKARIGSEYPGTSMLLLLRTGFTELAAESPASVSKASKAVGAAQHGTKLMSGMLARPGSTALVPMPALILARKIAPGVPAMLNIEFEITRTQRYAVYAFAQGRWFVVEREVKVGQDGNGR